MEIGIDETSINPRLTTRYICISIQLIFAFWKYPIHLTVAYLYWKPLILYVMRLPSNVICHISLRPRSLVSAGENYSILWHAYFDWVKNIEEQDYKISYVHSGNTEILIWFFLMIEKRLSVMKDILWQQTLKYLVLKRWIAIRFTIRICSPLIQAMDLLRTSVKPLPESMLTGYQLDSHWNLNKVRYFSFNEIKAY